MHFHVPGQPGTVAYSVIEYLKTLPPGTQKDTPQICAAIGCTDLNGLSTKLRRAVAHGMVRQTRATNGRFWLWSLPAEESDEVDQRCISAADAPPIQTNGLPSIFHLGERIASQQARNA